MLIIWTFKLLTIITPMGEPWGWGYWWDRMSFELHSLHYRIVPTGRTRIPYPEEPQPT